MPRFGFHETTSDKFSAVPTILKQIIFVKDTEEIYVDDASGVRRGPFGKGGPAPLPGVSFIRFGSKTFNPIPPGQARQALCSPIDWTQSSIRDLILYFNKPIGQNCYLQPMIYNRLARPQCETNGPTGNQTLFRNNSRGRQKKKGWAQVNISQVIQHGDGSGNLIPYAPLSVDSAGNKFYRNGIIKLTPGITNLVIPCDYQMKQMLYHTKGKSGRSIRGSFCLPDYGARSQIVSFSPMGLQWYADSSCFIIIEAKHPAASTISLVINGIPVATVTTAAGTTGCLSAHVKYGDYITLGYTGGGVLSQAQLYRVPYRKTGGVIAGEPMDSLLRSSRDLGDIRPTCSKWLSGKSYIKFAVSEYIPPSGRIGQPTYVRGQYKQGELSPLTLTSHRFRNKLNHQAVWVTDILER